MLFFCCVSIVFAHGGEEHENKNIGVVMSEGLKKCLFLEVDRAMCYASLCERDPGYMCAEDVLDAAVPAGGAGKAMMALHDIMASSIFAITSDGHLLSHIIGRSLSRNFGSTGENFLRCPSDFNNGCFHGFFEDTLAKVDDPVRVATDICESMPADTPSKEKSYCYHGAGHVFMMNESHHLDRALELCLSLPAVSAAESCWQGVFMENAGEREWELKKKSFRKNEPLYPCTVVEDKFKPECYINHHGYLIRHYSTSWDALIEVCLDAGEYIDFCLGGLGLMLPSSYWVDVVAEDFGIVDKSHIEKIAFLCGKFPEEYVEICYDYVVPGFLNFDGPNAERVSRLCESIDETYQYNCFERVGSYLSNLVSSEVQKIEVCASVPEKYRDVCSGVYQDLHEEDFFMLTDSDGGSGYFDSLVVVLKRVISVFFHHFLAVVAHLAYAHSEDDITSEMTNASSSVYPEIHERVKHCLSLQNARDVCYASLCEDGPGYICAEDVLRSITTDTGPEDSMQVLKEMIDSPLFLFNAANEGHSLAHVVGRTTADYFGGTGDVFLRCPTFLDYGCQHGFLEDALTKVSSPAEAVTNICESLPDKPAIGRPNCYHGSGHGVMMNESYDLGIALAVCDMVPDSDSCWTGVFMENVNGYLSGRIQEQYPENYSFSVNNPLTPCDTVDERYREYCYRQHMPYLARYFRYDLQKVIDSCLTAEEHVGSCVWGFGAYSIYDDIQADFLPDFKGGVVDKVIHMCNQFPEEYRETCYTPAIDQLSIFYGVGWISEFCEKVDEQYRRQCYRTIGGRLKDLVLDNDEVKEGCALVPEQYRNACLGERQGVYEENFVPDIAAEEIIRLESQFVRLRQFISVFFRHLLELFVRPVYAHSEEDKVSSESETKYFVSSKIQQGVEHCLSFSRGSGDLCYVSLCDGEPGYVCAEDILSAVTVLNGPKYAMTILDFMVNGTNFNLSGGEHQLTHSIGRMTSLIFGSTGKSFLMCPVKYEHGCYHGFFEDMMEKVGSPSEVAMHICESLSEDFSNDKFECYHGMGHGIMMNESYNLERALAACDELPERWQKPCWDGVFMENLGGGARNEIPKEHSTFRDDDPLAPCSRIDREYRPSCYEKQAHHISSFYGHSAEKIAAACMQAGEYVPYCISGFVGILGPGSENVLSHFPGSHAEKVIRLCGLFPDEYAGDCYIPAVYVISLHHGVEGGTEFCMAIDEKYRKNCFGNVHKGYVINRADVYERADLCAGVPELYRAICQHGYVGEQGSVDFEMRGEDAARSSAETKENKAVSVRGMQDSFSALALRFFRFVLSRFFENFIFAVHAHDDDKSIDASLDFSVDLRTQIEKCLLLREGRDLCYASLCDDGSGYVCAESMLTVITAGKGPETAIEVLSDMVSGSVFLFNPLLEGHNLAHVVGKTASRVGNGSGVAFLRCPTTFAYGCQHGFFEAALLETDGDPAEAVLHICESVPDKPALGKVSCYHGAGHGIMMNESHDLYRSLAICDQLPFERVTCYDGVFMEHINARGRPGVERDWFSDTNPLAPCNVVDEVYRYGCYYRHGNYLFGYYNYSLEDVVNACLGAGKYIEVCLKAVSGSILLPDFQKNILPDFEGSFLERTSYLCDQFPEGFKLICYTVSAGEITIFYGVADAWEFCTNSAVSFKKECFAAISQRVDDLAASEGEKVQMCNVVPESWRHICLGINIFDEGGELFDLQKSDTSLFDTIADSLVNFVLGVVRFINVKVFAGSSADRLVCDSRQWRYVSKISDVEDTSSAENIARVVLDDFDYFGDDVSLHDDVLVVGAFGDDDGGIDRGATYLFERDSGDRWVQSLKISDTDGGDGLFPLALEDVDRLGRGVSYDGAILAVGAYYVNDKKGAVYLFEKDVGGTWTQLLQLSDTNGGDGLFPVALDAGAHFGASVSLYNGTLAVGSYLSDFGRGAVYLFERDNAGMWTQSLKIFGKDIGVTFPGVFLRENAAFGRTVSLHGDFLAVGAPRDGADEEGAVYIFKRDDSDEWSLSKKISGHSEFNIHFGSSVSLYEDLLAVGALKSDDNGVVYLFEKDSDDVWLQSSRIFGSDILQDGEGSMFGTGLSLYRDYLAVGSYLYDGGGVERGVVHFFEKGSEQGCTQ